MLWAKLSTAITISVGPILDSTGAEYTGAVIGSLSIRKQDGSSTAMAAAATLTHVDNGHYTLVTTTANLDTLGRLQIRCNQSTYQMPPVEIMVLPATVFDTLVTNGTLASTTSGRTIVTDAAGLVDANAVKVGPTGTGTAQTARDVGASVLLSTGTGTGQLDFTAGVVKANLAQILGTALTETAGLLAAAFKQWFNVAAPTGTVNSIPNAVAGAASGIAIVGSNVGVATSVSGAVGSVTGAVGSVGTGGIVAASFAADTGLVSIRSNTAQAGAAATITLDASASATTDFYVGAWVRLTGGTGSGQVRLVTAYNGATKVATVHRNWATNPDNTSTFAIVNAADIQGLVLTDTVTTYTGNTPQTGDSFTRIGAAGAGLTAVGVGTGGIAAASFVAGAIDAAAIATDAIGSAEIAAGAVTKIQAGLATPTNITAGTITTVTTATNLTTNNDKTGYGLSAAAVQAIWDALTSALTTVNSIGKRIVDFVTTLVYAAPPVAAPTAVQNRQEMDSNSTKLANLDATVSSRTKPADTQARVTLTDTLTTYTGDTPQTGDAFLLGNRTVARGTVGATAPTTTSFTPSALTPAGISADQFKGRIIIFDITTTTTALRGQATDITASSAAALPLLTFTALTNAPVSGDQFTIV